MKTLTSSPVLQVRDLNFAYPGEPPLLRRWSATIGGGVTLLHGDTGSGKSTILRLLAGGHPVDGQLVLGGVALADDRPAYRRQVFLCDASTDAFDAVTGRDCTEALCGSDPGFDPALWQGLVDGFALGPHIDKPVYMLSTGSRRKLWLAAALAAGRRLTLLDEPAGALDARSVRCLWAALGALAGRADQSVVLASSERIDALPLAATIDL
jgi:ABC-type multidrug transport system ATPase subunit